MIGNECHSSSLPNVFTSPASSLSSVTDSNSLPKLDVSPQPYSPPTEYSDLWLTDSDDSSDSSKDDTLLCNTSSSLNDSSDSSNASSDSTKHDILWCNASLSPNDSSGYSERELLPCKTSLSPNDTSDSSKLDIHWCNVSLSPNDTSGSSKHDILWCNASLSPNDTSGSSKREILPCKTSLSTDNRTDHAGAFESEENLKTLSPTNIWLTPNLKTTSWTPISTISSVGSADSPICGYVPWTPDSSSVLE